MKASNLLTLIGVSICLSSCAGHAQPVRVSGSAPVAQAHPTAPIAQDVRLAPDIKWASAKVEPRPAAPSLHGLSIRDLASLKDLTASDLLQRFGEPDFTRHEASAQIWQYRGASCVLDLFLYPDGDSLRVEDAVTRSRLDINGPTDSCMPTDSGGTNS